MTRTRLFAPAVGLFTIFLAGAIAACGSNGAASGPVPTVSSTNPANAATGVAVNSGFAVTFSDAMDPASITTATFTLTAPGGAVAGSVTYLGVTGLFTPAANLAANTLYTATIAIGASSAGGQALAASYSWQVTTGAAQDLTPPAVASTTPADGATAVATNSAITATFSEAMAPATLSAATFKLTAPGAVAVAGAVTYAGLTAVFQPASALAASTAFTATLTTGATDLAGNALAASHAWTFTTGASPDTVAPTVASTLPLPSATGVLAGAAVRATFSEAMAPLTIGSATFTLAGPGGVAVPGTVVFDAPSKVATFQATATLAASTGYLARVHGGTGGVKDLAGNPLATDYAWAFTTAAAADTTAPVLSSTTPADAATSVATNSAVTATFSEAMTASTLNATSFTLTAPGAVAVAGVVTYAGLTAVFRPASALAASTAFTALITTGAKDLAGNALATNHAWSFTTGALADTAAPTVVSTSPLASAIGVLTSAAVQVTFSEAMAPQTIGSATLTLTGPGSVAVPGSVAYDVPGKVATFQATAPLAANTSYLALVRGGVGGVTDLAGNALASDTSWTFTTGARANLAPVLLGSSASFVILAKSAISTVPASAITGDVGLSPAAESFITGFALTDATGYATSTQVVGGGKVYAADQAPPTPSNLTTAVSDMELGYTDAAGRPTPDFLELGTGAIGGMTLTPGLYKWTSTVTILSDVTLAGGANDVWIFQISGDVSMASAKNVFLSGGARAKNVFWQVAGAVDLGTTAHFEGIILSQTAITLRTGATMNGRTLAQTAVVLDAATVTQPAP